MASHAGGGGFPKNRQRGKLAGLSDIRATDHFAVGKRVKFTNHLRPIELDLAAAYAAAHGLNFFDLHFQHVGGHHDHLLDGLLARFQHGTAH